ncbi:MAG: hypothetical protein ABSB63_16105 [Spirochaetia bacterium]|jgi:hypothetical protein
MRETASTALATLPTLIASLREEGEKKQLVYNFSDPGFIRKIENLAKRVPREFEITLAFRAFLEDPAHQSPFWFADRFDRYKGKVAQGPAKPAKSARPDDPQCPRCMIVSTLRGCFLTADTEPGMWSCDRCRTWFKRDPDGSLHQVEIPHVDTSALPLPWRRPA